MLGDYVAFEIHERWAGFQRLMRGSSEGDLEHPSAVIAESDSVRAWRSERSEDAAHALQAGRQVLVGQGIGKAGVAGGTESLSRDQGDPGLVQDPCHQVGARAEPVADEGRQVGKEVEGAL